MYHSEPKTGPSMRDAIGSGIGLQAQCDASPVERSISRSLINIDKALNADAEQIQQLRGIVERVRTVVHGPAPKEGAAPARAPYHPGIDGLSERAHDQGYARQQLLLELQVLLGFN